MLDKFIDPNTKEIQMIVFHMGSEEYCVPITYIQEIIMLQQPTRIPKAPSFVQGVINLRGNIIPIIDAQKRFSMGLNSMKSTSESRIIVLEVENGTIGLIVDSVSEVVHLKTDDIEPPPVDMEGESDFLWGVGKFQHRLLILLNPEKFLNMDEDLCFKKFNQVNEIIKQAKEVNKLEQTC